MSASAARRTRRPRSEPRLWRVPPALLRDPDESFEGGAILEEVEGDLGLLLWQSARDVLLRVDAGPLPGLFASGAVERRRALLGAAAIGNAPLTALEILAALVADPARADAAALRFACEQLSLWAEGVGARRTAITFAQAAAAADPDRSEPALRAGELAVEAGQTVRGETWLRRAVALARREKAWAVYADAFLVLGRLAEAREGETAREAARVSYTRAYRAARRHALREQRGRALLGLMRLARADGRSEVAERLARSALRVFGRPHPERPALLRALAELRLEREAAAEARRAAEALLGVAPDLETKLAALALLARTAAETGDRPAFEEAWTEAWRIVERHSDVPAADRALTELSRAAARAGDWPRMKRAAQWALRATRTASRAGRHSSEDRSPLAP